MAILKMVRDQSRKKPHDDSLHDLVAYASLYGEARMRGEVKKQQEQKEPEGQQYTQGTLTQKIALAHQAAQEARYAGC